MKVKANNPDQKPAANAKSIELSGKRTKDEDRQMPWNHLRADTQSQNLMGGMTLGDTDDGNLFAEGLFQQITFDLRSVNRNNFV